MDCNEKQLAVKDASQILRKDGHPPNPKQDEIEKNGA